VRESSAIARNDDSIGRPARQIVPRGQTIRQTGRLHRSRVEGEATGWFHYHTAPRAERTVRHVDRTARSVDRTARCADPIPCRADRTVAQTQQQQRRMPSDSSVMRASPRSRSSSAGRRPSSGPRRELPSGLGAIGAAMAAIATVRCPRLLECGTDGPRVGISARF
jgi:hypothetical protein